MAASSQNSQVFRATTTAPVNIAVIKYWGKRDATLNLPTNSSLSVTLSQRSLRTLTTASCSAKYPTADELILNGKPQDIQSSKRTLACLSNLRSLRQALEAADASLPKLSALPLRIVSENNFPTAAGLASSAAGFAALVRAVADLYQLPQSPRDLSRIARQGSGSACRSLMGGYVAWRAGDLTDGSDSLAEEVAPASHWPEMRAAVLVVSAEKKDVPSTEGMQTTVATSNLFATRATSVVPERMTAIETAIQNKDFPAFAEITMRDSNGFHATCLDSWPPIFYMNDVSRAAVRLVHDINRAAGRTVCAYTFDAGPNAVIYYLEKDSELVAGTIKAILGASAEGWDGPFYEPLKNLTAPGVSLDSLDSRAVEVIKDGVSRVILTGVGEGPISVTDHLVSETGDILSQ
ncbi:diphosphomevalonate decarboxylase MVD1 [Aspergillus melleus]|uniref:diphosphomevalonate decarboxylase MVD1 n=1 Tax=Aspergillus melleus TaxID=138277 RepID=UPI001E8D5B99|nr:diphosphomevalonate decarboxylase [Aspergillus melleus]KAH8428747.1 diphosphomevalonate decarboxylase [Aspergillus melleus]